MFLFISDNDFNGIVLAVVFIIAFLLFHKQNSRLAFYFDNLILAVCSGITMGFSSSSAISNAEFFFDISIAMLVLMCALQSLYKSSAKRYLVYGYMLHAGWDLLHHSLFHMKSTRTPYWYPSFCLIYDVFVAIYYYRH